MPTLASKLDKFNWSTVKQLIYSEFQNTNIEIYIYHKNNENITKNWKSKDHVDIINNIHNLHNNINNKNETKINDIQHKPNTPNTCVGCVWLVFVTFQLINNV